MKSVDVIIVMHKAIPIVITKLATALEKKMLNFWVPVSVLRSELQMSAEKSVIDKGF